MLNVRTLRRAGAVSAAVTVTLLSIQSASAQTASAVIREGDQLPGAAPGQLVTSLNNPNVNHVNGWAEQINTSADGGVTSLSHIWGNASGGAGTVIRTEGTFGAHTQTSFESFWGLSDSGSVAYSPSIGAGDSVWLDSTPVAVAGDAHPTLPGQFWTFGSRPGITAGGTPYFSGGISTTSGGSTSNRGLFFGPTGGTVLLLGGQTPPNMPRALSTGVSQPAFDYRVSANGSNFIGQAQMIAPTTNDAAMVMNGSGLVVGGSLAQEAQPIPASVGGQVAENWANFDFAGINNAGDYFFTGDSSLATTADEFIFKNGQMLYRDGMVLDGQTVQGDIEAAYMNENGDIAHIWDVAANTLEALYVNGDLLLKEGDLVDLDGNGTVEANSVLVGFSGIASLAMGDRYGASMVDIYFTAEIDVNGTTSTTDDIEAMFRISAAVPEPASLSLLALGAFALKRRSRR